jgi:flagellar hook protein FlgE
MSLFGALNIGVAGLDAFSNAMSVTSSNIANVNTVGYKASSNDFATLLSNTIDTTDSASGVVQSATQNVTQQGILQAASSTTDLGIQGNGFFVVNQDADGSGAQLYTRVGSFSPDANGNLENANGYYLMGYATDPSGATDTTLSSINVDGLSGKAQATTTMSLQANLQSSTAAGAPAFSRTVNVYDSQGGQQPLTFNFTKSAANTWNYTISYAGNASNITGANPIYTGTMAFNTDGTLANADTTQATPSGDITLNIPWSGTSGLAAQTVTVDMGTLNSSSGMSQFDTASTLTNSTTNGALFGSLSGVTVDTSGNIEAQFTNGLSQKIGEVPLATFANEDGLSPTSGTAFAQSATSGAAVISNAGTNGAGNIQDSSLEGSTVDLASEFTDLITTQRAYSASARIVTTADQMLQTLEQLPST